MRDVLPNTILQIDLTGSGIYIAVASIYATKNPALRLPRIEIESSFPEIRSANIRGFGLYRNEEMKYKVMDIFLNEQMVKWQIVTPSHETITGPFFITYLTNSPKGYLGVEIEINDAGSLTFT